MRTVVLKRETTRVWRATGPHRRALSWVLPGQRQVVRNRAVIDIVRVWTNARLDELLNGIESCLWEVVRPKPGVLDDSFLGVRVWLRQESHIEDSVHASGGAGQM